MPVGLALGQCEVVESGRIEAAEHTDGRLVADGVAPGIGDAESVGHRVRQGRAGLGGRADYFACLVLPFDGVGPRATFDGGGKPGLRTFLSALGSEADVGGEGLGLTGEVVDEHGVDIGRLEAQYRHGAHVTNGDVSPLARLYGLDAESGGADCGGELDRLPVEHEETVEGDCVGIGGLDRGVLAGHHGHAGGGSLSGSVGAGDYREAGEMGCAVVEAGAVGEGVLECGDLGGSGFGDEGL